MREIRSKRRVGGTQIPGPSTVANKRPALHQIDERRGGIVRASLQFGDDASHCRPAAERLQVLLPVSRLALKRVMLAVRLDQRPNEGELLRRFRQPRHSIGNVQSRHGGGDRKKLAADLDRGVRLRIDRIHLRRSAVQMNVDDGFTRATDPRLRFGAEQLAQRQAADAQRPDRQKLPPRNPVAMGDGSTQHAQHETPLQRGHVGYILPSRTGQVLPRKSPSESAESRLVRACPCRSETTRRRSARSAGQIPRFRLAAAIPTGGRTLLLGLHTKRQHLVLSRSSPASA